MWTAHKGELVTSSQLFPDFPRAVCRHRIGLSRYIVSPLILVREAVIVNKNVKFNAQQHLCYLCVFLFRVLICVLQVPNILPIG